jgi:hypothetical protein
MFVWAGPVLRNTLSLLSALLKALACLRVDLYLHCPGCSGTPIACRKRNAAANRICWD